MKAEDKYLRFLLIAAICLFVLLYIASISKYWKITPDSVTYVEGARSLALGKGYTEIEKPISPFPPVTSVIFSVVFIVFGQNYFFLNMIPITAGIVTIFFTYLCFRKRSETTGLVVALLVAASIEFYIRSTYLLSDIIFAAFLMSSIHYTVKIFDGEQCIKNYTLAITLIFLASMTQTIGVALPIAIIIYMLLKKKFILVFYIGLALIIITAGLWEIRCARLGGDSYAEQLTYKVIYSDAGTADIITLITRIPENIAVIFRDALAFLLNGLSNNLPAWVILGIIFATGFFLSVIRQDIFGIFALIYILAISLHSAYSTRLIAPLLPIIMYFAVCASIFIKQQINNKSHHILYTTIIIIFLIVYSTYGFSEIVQLSSKEHTSQFDIDIKYPHNYEEEELALWLRDNTPVNAIYMAQHPNIMNKVSERKGVYYPFTKNESKILKTIKDRKVDYILIDKIKKEEQEYLIPVIENNRDRFEQLFDKKYAALYKVVK